MGPKGLQIVIVGFSSRDDLAAMAAFGKKYAPNLPVGVVDGEFFLPWMQIVPETRPHVPMVTIIDRRGMIQAQYLGDAPMMEEKYVGANLRAKLMQYLGGARPAEQPPPKKGAAKK